MALLRLSVDGKTYDYDPDTLGMREALDLEKATGMTVTEFTEGLQKGKAMSLIALFWLARRRNGEDKLKFSDVDGQLATVTVETVEDESETDAEVPLAITS